MRAEFDTFYTALVEAFGRHQDLRRGKAPVADLARSAGALHEARMRAYQALPRHR
ncbi:MAG: hypothetical protein H0V05_01515 [Euzebyaceae bacterium]|jgi:hypothetical protein|nr:hypothetical protein [Euzebyaceae bacterium]MBA3851599.1 hypothetical protein [Chloroflexota bacterium]